MVLCHCMNTGLVVGTLRHYFMQKNLFELFTLTGRGHAKPLGANAWARAMW